jgi:hypothetical protein
MHPMLISALADQIVRERARSCEGGLSRSLASLSEARGPRPARRRGFGLMLRPLVRRRTS